MTLSQYLNVAGLLCGSYIAFVIVCIPIGIAIGTVLWTWVLLSEKRSIE